MDARRHEGPPALSGTPTEVPGRAGRRRGRVARILRLLVLIILPAVVLAAGVAGFAYLRATKPKVAVAPPPERIRPVETVPARRGDAAPVLTLYGQIAAGRSVDLRALVAGEVVSIAPGLVEGGVIAAGETVLRIDPFAYEGAVIRARADLAETAARLTEIEAREAQERSALARAEEQLVIAQRDNDRLRQLAESGAATQRALDDSNLRLSQSQAALEARQKQMAVYRAQADQTQAVQSRLRFALAQAERNLADTALKAPFAGLVSSPAAETGKLLNVNDRVATLVASEALEVRFSLSASQYAELTADGTSLAGRSAGLLWGGPSAGVQGAPPLRRDVEVTRVAAQAAGGHYDLFARFLAPPPPALRPGSFVEVEMSGRTLADVVRVPAGALLDGRVGIVEEGRLRRVPVTLAAAARDEVFVRGAIPDGAAVVVTPLVAPVDGERVEARPRSAP